jgi:hypothetical protein
MNDIYTTLIMLGYTCLMINVIIILIGSCIAHLLGWIMILIEAYKESVTQLIRCFIIPFYYLYYLFAKYKKDNKIFVIILYFGGIASYIIGYILFERLLDTDYGLWVEK